MKSFVVFFSVLIVLAAVFETDAECNAACPDDLNYVCAKAADGTQEKFENECMMKLAQCQHPAKGYTLLKQGPC